MPFDSSVDIGQLRNHSDSWCFMSISILLLTSFTYFCNILHYFTIFTFLEFLKHVSDSKTIKQGLSAMGIWWDLYGFMFLAFCQVSEQSEEKLPAETHHRPNDGTAADASKVAPCGGIWVELGREMQTFWFFRGDRSGRSSDVSCPLILQWTLDNYGTILIHELSWYVLRIFE